MLHWAKQHTAIDSLFRVALHVAIASYVSAISPKFSDLTPAQRAVDDMLAATLEDIIAGCAATIFERNGKTHATVSATFLKCCHPPTAR